MLKSASYSDDLILYVTAQTMQFVDDQNVSSRGVNVSERHLVPAELGFPGQLNVLSAFNALVLVERRCVGASHDLIAPLGH
jgi:hypothetical protein